MIWPNEPSPVNAIAAWCKKLLAACRASQVKPGPGYKVQRTANGTILEIDQNPGGVVYVKCCLEDDSILFLPVVVRGRAFRTNAGTTTAISVVETDVPDGSAVLE